jgi:hypothetical protein
MTMKQEPKERSWVAMEPCEELSLKGCVASNTCAWRNSQCVPYSLYKRLALRQLNKVMKPFKHYMFTEFQVSNIKHLSFEVDKNTIKRKPPGLWFALGDEWLQHLKKTNFWMNKYNYVYELELDMSKMIMVNTMKELQNFSSEYGVLRKDTSVVDIDWNMVITRTKKQGIIVPHNFKKSHRKYSYFNKITNVFHDLEWYLSWDIASGVIWNSTAIKNINMIYRKEQGEFVTYKK